MATAATAVQSVAVARQRRRAKLSPLPAKRRDEAPADGALSARWLEAWLGVRASRLAQLEAEGALIALAGSGSEPAYPVWQFGPDGSILPGTRRVIAAAAAADVEPARLHELMGARVGLADGGHLAGMLREGRVDHVVSVVRAAGSDA